MFVCFVFVCVCVCVCADISKVQDDEVGDGTTSVVVLACELLKVTTPYQLLMTFLLKLTGSFIFI